MKWRNEVLPVTSGADKASDGTSKLLDNEAFVHNPDIPPTATVTSPVASPQTEAQAPAHSQASGQEF